MRVPLSPALIAIIAAWLVMGLATVLRPRPPQGRQVQRARGWSWGLALQVLAIALLWTLPRRDSPGLWLSAAAIALATASVAVILISQRTLGQQFAYQARLVEGHRLITAGPYGWVRNPIYSALFGLALATGLVVSEWLLLPFFAILYAAGTLIRVRTEERLLRARFGREFDDYARRVPALVPWCKL
jgi:protein-S-isoprenylcysteine O-methyltransferase Ste14